ncbi:MAG: hypothetical protein HN337_02115 [Deltaproteobacteria bacterium]|jgi:glycosyltransferase 2 family protein|nr:hypothetical protein [Deltaproteobacteria bacterium]
MTKKFTKHIRYLFLAIGAVFFALLIRKIGIETVLSNMRLIGWWFVAVLSISGTWYMFYTFGWMQFLHRLSDGIRFWDLFRIKITGEAVNTLTPINFIGGDPMRIYLLKKNFPVSEGAASVVVDRTLHSIATLLVIMIGIIVSFLTFDNLPANIKYGVPIALIVSLAFMIFILIHQRRGFFGLMINICKRLRIKREFSEKTVNKFMQLDAHIVEFYEMNHKGFIIALCSHIFGRLLGIAEIYIIGTVVSSEFTFFTALVLAALAPMVNAVFAFIPGALGILEGAYSGVLYLMHMDPATGITIQIAKRLRAIFWILLGLYFLGAHDRKKVWEEEALIEQV